MKERKVLGCVVRLGSAGWMRRGERIGLDANGKFGLCERHDDW